ncbi:hypothetical protein [Flavobacterium sp.]|uniref:hypothetical protein n=1 Tax=Flavobacterium sp. TaxID=239 RepID=UPI00374FE4BB
MKKLDSKLFQKLEDAIISKQSLAKINGGKAMGPGGTTNDCTGTGGDCWDADCGTNVVDDMTWTGGKDSGNDACN